MSTPRPIDGRNLAAHKNYIGGDWRPAAQGMNLDVLCPSDGRPFAQIARSGAADVDAAVSAARTAHDSGDWGKLAAVERGRLISRLGALVLDHFDELAGLEARDTGKPISQARADITATARYFEFYGGAADKVHGDTIPFLAGFTALTLREPHGVTGHIIPWNYPAQMVGRTLGAALAMGNATVMKPAEDACLTPLRIARLAAEAGFPAGAINIVTGLGEEAGEALARHPDIDFLSFTGSPEVGTRVQTAAAASHVGCVLELGGKSPQLLFADADLDAALPVIVKAIVQNGGQTCSAGSRLLVERSAYDAVTTDLSRRFSTLRAGTHEMDLDCGALINAKQADRVRGYMDRARARGIPLLAQGSIADSVPEGGFFVRPSLFGPVPEASETSVAISPVSR